ncbi:uncharacterized protein LOC132724614 [Ruditapes philippinarum]|uniref:uncharacterized protein LOC132724614 n=1 Tax=Ruditapes philippinarum TaxID=129788 RepID=UPI00295ADD42|nr:uncharacterized protein LOC132724614 [Ruditapes philippinarum]
MFLPTHLPYPNRQLVFYTKSHYLAIKQPFSKKYLLPPVRTFYAERPAAKRVVVPAPAPRQVVVPPPRQEVVKPNVYHVQYKASPNQIVHRTKLTENIDEDFRLQTTNTSQYQKYISKLPQLRGTRAYNIQVVRGNPLQTTHIEPMRSYPNYSVKLPKLE